MRILVAEDDYTCRCLLDALLAPLGRCDTAADGTQAVQAVERAIAEARHYDLICLDITMPQLDGHIALARIRRLEEVAGIWPGDRAAKIVMVTASGTSHAIMQAFRSQADAYLVKPVSHSKLWGVLAQLQLVDEAAAKASFG